jgi:hypothetical protein
MNGRKTSGRCRGLVEELQGMCLRGLRTTAKILSQGTGCSDRDYLVRVIGVRLRFLSQGRVYRPRF